MRTIGNRIATPLFALLFTASLAFGVSSSFAQARQEGACPDDGWSINAGRCTTPEYCNLKCQGRWFEGGDCITGTEGNCCVCRA
jgi:hypothetical protein